MNLPVPLRRFDPQHPEMVDAPDADPGLLRGELRNLRIINRFLGGVRATQRALMPMLRERSPGCPLEILDLATGSGDIPVSLIRTLQAEGHTAVITAIDNNETVLQAARQFAVKYRHIRFESGDIRALPYPSKSYDFVLCSLALHHFSIADAIHILGEMDRLSRVGFILNDLSRSYLAAISVWIYTRLTTTNVMTRYDAIASVFSAFTRDELSDLFRRAEIGNVNIYEAPFFRLLAVKIHAGAANYADACKRPALTSRLKPGGEIQSDAHTRPDNDSTLPGIRSHRFVTSLHRHNT